MGEEGKRDNIKKGRIGNTQRQSVSLKGFHLLGSYAPQHVCAE